MIARFGYKLPGVLQSNVLGVIGIDGLSDCGHREVLQFEGLSLAIMNELGC
jgi:hypothetical protein